MQRVLKRSAAVLLLITGLIFSLSAGEPRLDAPYDREAYYPYTDTVLIGAEIGYPPYSLVNEEGEADGFSVELITEALASMGLQPEFVTGTWASVKNALEEGYVQALPLVGRTAEWEPMFDFTFPYLVRHGTILVRQGREDICSPEDLAGMKVAVLRGDSAEIYARSLNVGALITAVDTFEEALLDLSEGVYDAVIIQKLLAYELINQLGLTNLRTVGEPLESFSQSFCFAVRKGDSDLLSLLNESLAIIVESGTYQQLYNRWFGPLELQGSRYRRIIVGGDTGFPPYEFLDENGEPSGFNTALTYAIAEALDLDVEVVLQPWQDARQSLADGSVQLLQGVIYSVERDMEMGFSPPHSTVAFAAASRKGEDSCDALSDIAGKRVLVQKSDIMHEMALSYIEDGLIVEKDSQREVLESLSRGEGDFGLVSVLSYRYWEENGVFDNLVLGEPIHENDYGYSAMAYDKTLLTLFSGGLSVLKSSGEYDRIYDQWLGGYEPQSGEVRRVLLMIVHIAVPLAAAAVLLIFLWFRSLRREVRRQTRLLSEQKNLLQRIAATSPVGITVTDVNGGFLFINEAARSIVGAGESDSIDPEFPFVGKVSETLLDQRRWITRSDGSRRLLSINAAPLLDDGGVSAGTIAVISDITDTHLAEEAAAKEREQLAVTLYSIAEGVITIDVTQRIVIMNRVAEELTGWPLSEAGGRQFNEIFQVADQEGELDEKKLTLLALKSGMQYERSSGLTLLTRDGKELPAAVNVAPIRSGSGETLGAVLVFRDMTRENKLMDVVQRNGKLESLGIMAGGIAHDFNNLLGGLFGYVDLARSNIGRDREVKEYLDGAMEAYTRVRDLTQQLLTFSRGGEPSLRSGRLEEVIRKSVALSLSGSPCAADLRIAEDLPPVLYDENQIGQVLDNLLINARQAMPEGGTVTVSAAGITAAEGQIPGLNAGDYIKVSVRDTGPGIPDTITQHVFDPFFTTKESGSGLGLTTSYSIISRHNGMLDFTSRPGRGSEFVFYLPQAEREAEAADADEVSPEHRGSGVIVIMDDEMIIRDILGTMLRSMGYEVYGTSEGGEVLDLCRVLQQRGVVIRAIFLDLTVPAGMGGVKTAAELRRRQSEMPLFVSSGYSADPVMADPARFGFTASISKPYIQQDLSAFLNRYLP